KGRKLGVAGGPIDKSFLLLRALALRSGLDLRREGSIVYWAPPLGPQKGLQGGADGTVTFLDFLADLQGKGQRRAIDMEDVVRRLGAAGSVAMVGYVFDGAWAAHNRSAVDRFLAIAKEAKDILAASESEWARLAPRIGVADSGTLAIYRQ